MRNLFISLIAVMVLTVGAFAQPPATLWDQTYGGSDEEHGECVQQTTDGGFIVVGYTDSYATTPNNCDVWLVKVDADGNEDWSQVYGGSEDDYGEFVQQTSDGGYVIVGHTLSYGAGNWDVYLIKTDSDGNELWSQTFGGPQYDRGYSVRQTTDGGYIIVGYTQSFGAGFADVWMIKTDEDGNEVWNATHGAAFFDQGYDVQETADGGYIVTGYTDTATTGNIWIFKTDQTGWGEWYLALGGTNVYEARGKSVQQIDDGGYIVAGWVYSFAYDQYDIRLSKVDAEGYEEWSRTFGTVDFNEEAYSVQQTTDFGYIIAGFTSSYTAGREGWLIKTDIDGIEEWNQTYGGTSGEELHYAQQTANGGYILAGFTQSYGAGQSDIWLVCLDDDAGVIDVDLPHPSTCALLPAYPNPFNPSTQIRFQLPVAGNILLQVFDIQGNLVANLCDGWQQAGSYEAGFDASGLSSGIYLARLTAGDFNQTQKLILMK